MRIERKTKIEIGQLEMVAANGNERKRQLEGDRLTYNVSMSNPKRKRLTGWPLMAQSENETKNGDDDRSAPDGTQKRLTGAPDGTETKTSRIQPLQGRAAIRLCCGNQPLIGLSCWGTVGGGGVIIR
jgi:hypothetical protein